jgi:heme exporter protein CcmB
VTLLAQAAAVAGKDLRIEARGHRIAGSVLPLAGSLLIVFALILGPDPERLAASAPGLAWLTLLFSAVLAIKRGHDAETEDGALEGLLLAPARRSAIFLGKTAALTVELLLLLVVLLIAAGLLVGWPGAGQRFVLVVVSLLGTAGLAAVGSLFGLMTEAAHARGATLPLLMLPVAVPVLVFAIKAAEGQAGTWIGLLVLFDAAILAVGALAARHVVED